MLLFIVTIMVLSISACTHNSTEVVVTCSDSRVPPEHIFGAGLGDLFVIRNAGNVIGEYGFRSLEYGAEHLESKPVVVIAGL